MLMLLNPRVWIALAIAAALAFTHFFTYRAGASNVRVQWAAQTAALQAAAAQAERENRATESRRSTNVIEAINAQSTRTRTLQAAADRSRDESDSLRHALAAATADLPSPNPNAGGHNTAARDQLLTAMERGINDLAQAGASIARAADGHASDTLTLQQAWPK